MAEMFKKYFADVYGVSGDDMDAYARKFENLDGPLRVAPFLGEEPDGTRQRFIVLYDERQNDLRDGGRSAYLQDMKVCLDDFFGHKKVKLTKITQESKSEICDLQLKNLGKMFDFRSHNRRCRIAEQRWRRKTQEEVLKEVGAVVGFSAYKTGMVSIAAYADNAKKRGGEANYNIVFVKNCEIDEDPFIGLLYDLYLSKGVILDPSFVTEDLSDAVRDDRDENSPCFCRLEEDWEAGSRGNMMPMMNQSRLLKKLRKRNPVFVTTVTGDEYETLRQDFCFTQAFPFALCLNELTREEKLQYMQAEAQKFGFTLNPDGMLESDLMSESLQQLLAKVMDTARLKMSDKECGCKLCLSDLGTGEGVHREESSPLEELNGLVGLESVKNCVKEIAAYVKNKGSDSLPCLHMVFRGNPGTGKTTVARIIGRLFAEAGVIKKNGKFVEADRNSLVSVYLGGTAAKTAKIVESALGGVLFIDEAYSLFAGDRRDYGEEAVSTLVKMMEDHRKDFVCILAGYTKQMDEMLGMNPGLRSRIQFYLDFEDYNAAQMTQIFENMCHSEKYTLSTDASTVIADIFQRLDKNKITSFANGRTVRNIFERIRMKQALRGNSNVITAADVKAVFADHSFNRQLLPERESARIGF